MCVVQPVSLQTVSLCSALAADATGIMSCSEPSTDLLSTLLTGYASTYAFTIFKSYGVFQGVDI